MIVNAPSPQLIGQQYRQQRQESLAAESLRRQQQQLHHHHHHHNNNNHQHHLHHQPQAPARSQAGQQGPVRLHEDASELLSFVLTGGPKWAFRIRQLNDGRVIVSRVDKGPAERSGLKVNDELISVNNVQLSGSPRSLLLLDHPDQQQLMAATGGLGPAARPSGVGDKTPLLEADQPGSAKSLENAAAAELVGQLPAGLLRQPVELSKLDFAYQLIKHSSGSNKLMLTVRRFLSAAYARASVAAASGSVLVWPSSAPAPAIGNLLVESKHQVGLNYAPVDPREPPRRPQTAAGYAYKCCDCYCDNEGE